MCVLFWCSFRRFWSDYSGNSSHCGLRVFASYGSCLLLSFLFRRKATETQSMVTHYNLNTMDNGHIGRICFPLLVNILSWCDVIQIFKNYSAPQNQVRGTSLHWRDIKSSPQ